MRCTILVEVSIKLRRNVLPGHATEAVWLRREKRSLLSPFCGETLPDFLDGDAASIKAMSEVPQLLLG